MEGLVDLAYAQRAGTLEFGDSRLSTRATQLRFSGAPDRRLQVDLESTDLKDFQPPVSLPIALHGGSAKFSGVVTGGYQRLRASGHVLLTKFSSQGQAFDRLEADVVVSAYGVEASQLVLDQGGARLQGQGRATLRDWMPDEAGPVSGSFSLRGLPVEKLLAEAGSKLPIRGLVSGVFQVAGTPRAPEATAKLSLAQAVAYGQRLDQGRALFRYAAGSLTVESFDLSSGPAQLHGSAVLAPGGSVKLEASGKGFRLGSIPSRCLST